MADDLIATDDDGAENVYRQDRCSPGTPPIQVNRSATGVPAEAGSFAGGATISADERFVAFSSSAENLHPEARGADH